MNQIKALVFDVFGTVVDWHSSVVKEGEKISALIQKEVNWDSFALEWRDSYKKEMIRRHNEKLPWETVDVLHRKFLERLIKKYAIQKLTEQQRQRLNLVWHRLTPWKDVEKGLLALKKNFIIGTLSNGNVSLLIDLAKFGNLPWDCIFSAEFFGCYKPSSAVYKGAVNFLNLQESEVMLVAAHKFDLEAAQRVGLKTAFVARPMENGPNTSTDIKPDPRFDIHAQDFIDLEQQLIEKQKKEPS